MVYKVRINQPSVKHTNTFPPAFFSAQTPVNPFSEQFFLLQTPVDTIRKLFFPAPDTCPHLWRAVFFSRHLSTPSANCFFLLQTPVDTFGEQFFLLNYTFTPSTSSFPR